MANHPDFKETVLEKLTEALGPEFHISSGWIVDKDAVFVSIHPVLNLQLEFEGVALIDKNFDKNFDEKVLPRIKAQLANWAYALQIRLEME